MSLPEIAAPVATAPAAVSTALVWVMVVVAVCPRELAFTRSDLPLDAIGLQTTRDGLPLLIRGDGQGLRTVGKRPACAAARQGEGNYGAGDRLVVFILDLNDGFARGAQADVVDGAFAFDHDQVEHRRDRGLGGCPETKRQQ